jgi:predicted nuclease with TOPRIM domain
MRKAATFLMLVFLTGCIGDQHSGDNSPVIRQDPPVINVPPSQTVDSKGITDDIKREITTSSNATANQLTGLVNASVSKLAEKVNGIEANLSDLVKVSAKLEAKLEVTNELKARLDAAVTATADLKAEMQNIVTTTASMDNRLKILTDIKNEMANAASAQVGLNNKFEQKLEHLEETITATAGRDVNMLPKTAVDLIQYNLWAMITIITTLCGVASTTIAMAYRSARKREQATSNLLLKVLSMVPEQHRETVSREIDAAKSV